IGITPRQFADALRLRRLKGRLQRGDTVTSALYEAGYGSASRLYEYANAQLGMTPATYRQGGRGMEIVYTIDHVHRDAGLSLQSTAEFPLFIWAIRIARWNARCTKNIQKRISEKDQARSGRGCARS